jgi:hypothetical protein
MKFLTTKLIGGLGNYLFQIASTYSKSIDENLNFFLDINDISVAHSNPDNYKNNIFRKLKFQEIKKPYYQYNEPSFNYLKTPKFKYDIKMAGYFQSEKYFIEHRNEILELFKIDDKTKTYLLEKYGEILNQDTCSIHIRRGDYLGLPNHHPTQSIEYYQKGIEIIGEEKHFLVFSDDIEWCKETFSFLKNKTFISGNQDYEDLYLMSMCQNNIIANSTFSWWGAWLNENKDKQVIIPSKWFGISNSHLNTNDLYCDKWIKI